MIFLRKIIFTTLLMVNNCFAIEINDLISVSCYDATKDVAKIGVLIRDEALRIKSDKKISAQQAVIELEKLKGLLEESKGRVFSIVSNDRDKLFRRFGSMLDVDIYIAIHAQMVTTAFIVANKNLSSSSDALTAEINIECVNKYLESFKIKGKIIFLISDLCGLVYFFKF